MHLQTLTAQEANEPAQGFATHTDMQQGGDHAVL
jgi:hypothetical protein